MVGKLIGALEDESRADRDILLQETGCHNGERRSFGSCSAAHWSVRLLLFSRSLDTWSTAGLKRLDTGAFVKDYESAD